MAGAARQPGEMNAINLPLMDVDQVVRFAENVAAGRTMAPIATVNGAVAIKPGTKYMLVVITTSLHFKLNKSDGPDAANAVSAGDMLIPLNTIFYFFSGENDQFVADQTTGVLMQLAL